MLHKFESYNREIGKSENKCGGKENVKSLRKALKFRVVSKKQITTKTVNQSQSSPYQEQVRLVIQKSRSLQPEQGEFKFNKRYGKNILICILIIHLKSNLYVFGCTTCMSQSQDRLFFPVCAHCFLTHNIEITWSDVDGKVFSQRL